MLAAHLHQAVFGIVAEVLDAAPAAAFFNQAAEAVVAVAFVLVGEHAVVAHQAHARQRSVEQVGGGVVGEGFALALAGVLAGHDPPAGIVMQQLLVLAAGLLVETAD
ncbi:hypothetical protein D3C80_768210 [compost metagenome]